jgi:hypothetical protein
MRPFKLVVLIMPFEHEHLPFPGSGAQETDQLLLS